MDKINEIRVKNLYSLVKKAGSIAKLARQHSVDATYISQLLNRYRSFGEKAARKMELSMNLSQNWFDQNHDHQAMINTPTWPFLTISVAEYDSLTSNDKEEIEAIIKIKLKKKDF